MLLGAYSVVRFSNNFSDQRINLGVVVWHPLDGFQVRFATSLAKVRAVDPRAQVDQVKLHIHQIRYELHHGGHTGREALEYLAPVPRGS